MKFHDTLLCLFMAPTENFPFPVIFLLLAFLLIL